MRNRLLKISTASLFTIASLAIGAQGNVASVVGSSNNEHYSKPNNNSSSMGSISPSTLPGGVKVEGLRESSITFTPNHGQIANMKGEPCPNVLYKGEASGTDIYLRETGISYVQTNMNEIVHKVNEQVEALIITGTIAKEDEYKKREELIQKEYIKTHRVDMNFANCNANIKTINEGVIQGHNNYYTGHCPNGALNIKQYSKVTYKNIYNGIDVSYYGDNKKGLKYDLIVQAHADPNQIKLHWQGAESIHLNRAGNLIIKTSVNELTESIPKVYQIINGEVVDIKAEYKLSVRYNELGLPNKKDQPHSNLSTAKQEGDSPQVYEVTFRLSNYNSSFPLIIDPWATYYGGTDRDWGTGVSTDAAGNVYLLGNTFSTTVIASLGFQTTFGGVRDAFLVKFDNLGNRLWATYYGGDQDDQGMGVAIDAAGNIYLSGPTQSTVSIASATGFQATYGGGIFDAFLVKLKPDGSREWATYYGGTGWDEGNAVATDGNGDVYLAGRVQAFFGPPSPLTSGGFQNAYGGSFSDAFLVKYSNTGNRIWATFYGGNQDDYGTCVATDLAGNVYLAGQTKSTNNIAAGGVQGSLGGDWDTFLVKFQGTGGVTSRLWATYYGGAGSDNMDVFGYGLVTDGTGSVYLAGNTNSSNSIAVGGDQMVFGGGLRDAFLVKFDGLGNLNWATYAGGPQNELMAKHSLAIDSFDNVYLLFEVEEASTNSLVDPCSYQPNFGGVEDQIIAKYKPNGKKICSTYLGGAKEDDVDAGGGIAINGNTLYIAGTTNGSYPVTASAFQTVYNGPNMSFGNEGGDAFLTSFCTNICENKTLNVGFLADKTTACINTPILFTPASNSCDTSDYIYKWTFTGGAPSFSNLPTPTVTFSNVGSYNVKLVVTTPCKKDSITKTNYITTTQCNSCNLVGQFTKGTAACSNCGCKEWLMVNATGGTPPYSYQWPDGYDKRYKNKVCPGSYAVKVTDKNGCSVDVIVSTP